MSVYPASTPIYMELVKNGAVANLLETGAIVKTAFCDRALVPEIHLQIMHFLSVILHVTSRIVRDLRYRTDRLLP